VLAHWVTDVLAGLAMGALVERCLRPLSKGAIRTETAARQTLAQPQRIESSGPLRDERQHRPAA
jgi:hypothetical protein